MKTINPLPSLLDYPDWTFVALMRQEGIPCGIEAYHNGTCLGIFWRDSMNDAVRAAVEHVQACEGQTDGESG
jgi:uncharacterized protein involved in propanediol utilization